MNAVADAGGTGYAIEEGVERDLGDIKEQMAKIGARTDYGTPQQYSDFLAAETAKFGAIIKQEGLQMDVG